MEKSHIEAKGVVSLNPIRVAIYARVSTLEQAEEGYSIDAQIENIKKKCEIENKVVVGVYADRGISGKSIENRFELQRLIEDSKKGLFDEVMVWKTSRLARNILDLLQIVNELEKNNVTFRSITEPYDTSTPTGKFLMNMIASVAEFERTTIIENLKMGMNARAKKGLKNGGRMLGYRSVGRGKDSRLEIVPEEAEIVRKIFNLYTEGYGYKAIANRLNKAGYRTVKGNLFGITAISDIISNPTYVGKIRFNRYVDYSTKRRKGKSENFILVDGQHKPIISEEVWSKAQEIKRARASKYPRSYSGEFPLTGLLRCPVCGYGMVASRTVNTLKDGTKKKIRYYSCGRFRNQGSEACSANSVRADKAEAYVFNRIKEVLLNEKVLKDIVDNLNKTREEKIKPLEKELENIRKQIENYNIKKKRIFELYEDGVIEKEILMGRLKEIEDILEKLNIRKNEILKEIELNGSEKIPYEVVREIMQDFEKLMSNADKEQRKLFLQLIINKITVDDNRNIDTIEIHFNENLKRIIKTFLGEEPSDDGGSSPFVFTVVI
ncbi:recombinase family protein [Caloranaerobacter azorensis]|uniref:Recombinase family protein n=1 Tax=Caloranaerobacter azorensis TaxID=116090 RepID=A0A6P1YFH6_9FIRM|nr:recombinase family protein [Caloranaerobacter azorensis]